MKITVSTIERWKTTHRFGVYEKKTTQCAVDARGEGAPKEHAEHVLKLMNLAPVTTQNQHRKKRGEFDCLLRPNPVAGRPALNWKNEVPFLRFKGIR